VVVPLPIKEFCDEDGDNGDDCCNDNVDDNNCPVPKDGKVDMD